MAEVFDNSEDPDQTPHSVAYDLGLHCLPITLLGVSQLQWVKKNIIHQIPRYLELGNSNSCVVNHSKVVFLLPFFSCLFGLFL